MAKEIGESFGVSEASVGKPADVDPSNDRGSLDIDNPLPRGIPSVASGTETPERKSIEFGPLVQSPANHPGERQKDTSGSSSEHRNAMLRDTLSEKIDEAIYQAMSHGKRGEDKPDEANLELHAARLHESHDDTVIRIPELRDRRGMVVVDTPDEYRVLLEQAYTVFLDRPEDVERAVNQIYDHEMAHARPVADEPNLTIKFGVKFTADYETETVNLEPGTLVSGTTTVRKYREMWHGPSSDLSETDKIMRGEHKHDH